MRFVNWCMLVVLSIGAVEVIVRMFRFVLSIGVVEVIVRMIRVVSFCVFGILV